MKRRCTLALIPIAIAISACGRIERTRQCVRVVEAVNGALDEIGQHRDAGPPSASSEREMATRYEKLAADLGQEKLDNPVLAKSVAEYRELLTETVRLLRRIADARDRKDPVTITISRRELTNHVRREKMIVMRIDAACQSP